MNKLISEQDSENYFTILTELNNLHKNIYTVNELCKHFGVSNKKLIDFRNGKVIDFWLLTQYAGIIGKNIVFYLE